MSEEALPKGKGNDLDSAGARTLAATIYEHAAIQDSQQVKTLKRKLDVMLRKYTNMARENVLIKQGIMEDAQLALCHNGIHVITVQDEDGIPPQCNSCNMFAPCMGTTHEHEYIVDNCEVCDAFVCDVCADECDRCMGRLCGNCKRFNNRGDPCCLECM